MFDGQKFCAVVKADAYGLGARQISGVIDDVVDYFAVSSKEEFWEIKSFVSKPILLLDPIYKNITKLASAGCEFCISNLIQLKKFIKTAYNHKDVIFKIHLAFNTGMNRFGFNSEFEILECFNMIKKTQNILIVGIFTHFYAGQIEYLVRNQSRKFKNLKLFLSKYIDITHVNFHCSNTSGFEFERGFNMCRIGLGMFFNNNKNIFMLESEIIEIQHVNRGENIGYGAVVFSQKNMKVAVVAIGYADGVFRGIAGRGFVIVNGCLCKILAVCMDSIIVDVTDANARLNNKVTLIGKNGGKEIFVCDFASWCDTIEYEVMTRISKRVKRVYIGGCNANYNWKVQGKKA